MPVHIAQHKGRLCLGAEKVRKAYQGNKRVYSSGNICTYHVDTGITYQEEVDEGESCLIPKTFTPAKAGWEFAGWRQDTAAAGEVLGSLAMGDDPVELYALFKQDVTLTTVANGTTNRDAKPRLYNNGNLVDPVFTVASPAKSGATFKGWSASAGSTAISNSSISNLSLAVSTARYAVFTYNTLTISHGAWTGSDSTVDRTMTFTLNENTHVASGTFSASLECSGWNNSANVWVNNILIAGWTGTTGNKSGNFSARGGSNTVRSHLNVWAGSVSVTLYIPGKTVVG